jgi:hypothetical protein
MKKDKNGFISMALVYTFLVVFLFLMLAILRTYTENDKYLEAINSQIDEDINKDKQNRSYILNRLLEDNTPQSYKSIRLIKPAGDKLGNGNGLFYIDDETITDENNDKQTTRIYFFRGSVENNHLVYADMCFRIVRTNEDGSIRIIYDGPAESNKCKKLASKPNVSVGNATFSNNETVSLVELNEGVIPPYDEANSHSPIIDLLNDWYVENIIEKEYADYVSINTLFCNNKKSYLNTLDMSFYDAKKLTPSFIDNSDRDIYDPSKLTNSLSLVCDQLTDQFMASDRTLSYPVGLLTAEEVLLAGGYLTNSDDEYKGGPDGMINKEYYLYTNYPYWTSSAYGFNVTSNTTYVVAVYNNGYMEPKHVTESLGVIPVISLSGDIKVSSGNGSANNPYILE